MRKSIITITAIVAAVLTAEALWAAPSESETRKRIIDTAQNYLGVPYVYGAESPEAFDCSGFVQYVYLHAADLQIPRNSKSMWAAGSPIEKTAAKPGDIFVFDTVGAGGPSHVAIFLGSDKMIHAISEGPHTGVVVSPITDRYFAPRVIGARYFIVSAVPAEPQPAPQPKAQETTKPVAQSAAPVASEPAKPAAQPSPAPAAPPAPPPAATKPAAQSAQAPASQEAAKPAAQAAAAPEPAKPVAQSSAAPAAPAPAAPPPAATIPATTKTPNLKAIAALADEPPVDQVGFVVKSKPEVIMDKIPAATGTAIAFTITNGTEKKNVFHIFFYKADVDFKKTKILREDREEIPVGGSVEIAPFLFTEPGIYRLNVKTADNTQLMQRTWKVVDVKR